MGCDIHTVAFRQEDNKYIEISNDFFDVRSYALFGFLADVRNYSAITPISQPRGLPEWYNANEEDTWDYHSFSWLTLEELESYDYDQIVEDRRCTRNHDGGCTCDPGQGEKMTLREFLSEWYFKELAKMRSSGVDVIVFWFDN